MWMAIWWSIILTLLSIYWVKRIIWTRRMTWRVSWIYINNTIWWMTVARRSCILVLVYVNVQIMCFYKKEWNLTIYEFETTIASITFYAKNKKIASIFIRKLTLIEGVHAYINVIKVDAFVILYVIDRCVTRNKYFLIWYAILYPFNRLLFIL